MSNLPENDCSICAENRCTVYPKTTVQFIRRDCSVCAEICIAFEPTYRALPKAVFQGDIANHLIDADGGFKGVFDFNLSGTETVLNYIFSESRSTLYDFGKRSAETVLDRSEQDRHDTRMARFISYACTHYKLSDAEKRAFAPYFQIAYPFLYQNYAFCSENLAEHGETYADTLLTWIERQMSRTDVSELLG